MDVYFCNAYCNDPKFSDRQVWANSVDPDQTAPVYIFCANSSVVKRLCSNFRIITAIFRIFTIHMLSNCFYPKLLENSRFTLHTISKHDIKCSGSIFFQSYYDGVWL